MNVGKSNSKCNSVAIVYGIMREQVHVIASFALHYIKAFLGAMSNTLHPRGQHNKHIS